MLLAHTNLLKNHKILTRIIPAPATHALSRGVFFSIITPLVMLVERIRHTVQAPSWHFITNYKGKFPFHLYSMNRTGIVIIIILILALAGIAYLVSREPETIITDPNATSTPPTTSNPPVTNQPAAPEVSIDAAAAPSNTTVVLSGSVRPNGSATTYRFQYGKTDDLGSQTNSQTIGSGFVVIPATGYLTGLTPSTQYYYRLTATNAIGTSNSSIRTFTTSATGNPPAATDAPTAATVAATEIERTSATIGGNINPRGSATSYWFEYGTTNALGAATTVRSAGSSNTTQAVSVEIDDLEPATQYYFRVNAQNDFGTVNGSILSFTTDGPVATDEPDVEIEAASAVAARSATLHGTVAPNGATTTYWFEYSTDTLIGSVLGTATPEQTVAGTAASAAASAQISGLSPNTKYNYRIAARNSEGTVRSEVMSFTTQGN